MNRLITATPSDFRFRSTLLSHGWLQLKPFGYADDYSALYRIQRLASGRVVRLSITSAEDEALAIDVDTNELTTEEEDDILRITGRIFQLDLDLASFYDRIAGLPRYEWIQEHGAGRLLRSPSVWEDLAKTLLTTNTTWAMTRAMVARLTEIGDPHPREGHAFPTPSQVARMSLDDLAGQVRAGYRNAYLHELATSIAKGRVDVESWADSSLPSKELFKRVRSLKGFGPYAAGSVLKLLGHYDELAIDSAARSMFKKDMHGGDELKDALIEKHYAEYGEWKGLVIWMDLMREWFLERFAAQ